MQEINAEIKKVATNTGTSCVIALKTYENEGKITYKVFMIKNDRMIGVTPELEDEAKARKAFEELCQVNIS